MFCFEVFYFCNMLIVSIVTIPYQNILEVYYNFFRSKSKNIYIANDKV